MNLSRISDGKIESVRTHLQMIKDGKLKALYIIFNKPFHLPVGDNRDVDFVKIEYNNGKFIYSYMSVNNDESSWQQGKLITSVEYDTINNVVAQLKMDKTEGNGFEISFNAKDSVNLKQNNMKRIKDSALSNYDNLDLGAGEEYYIPYETTEVGLSEKDIEVWVALKVTDLSEFMSSDDYKEDERFVVEVICVPTPESLTESARESVTYGDDFEPNIYDIDSYGYSVSLWQQACAEGEVEGVLEKAAEDAKGIKTMIGFNLDKPYNRMGDDGWSILESACEGKVSDSTRRVKDSEDNEEVAEVVVSVIGGESMSNAEGRKYANEIKNAIEYKQFSQGGEWCESQDFEWMDRVGEGESVAVWGIVYGSSWNTIKSSIEEWVESLGFDVDVELYDYVE